MLPHNFSPTFEAGGHLTILTSMHTGEASSTTNESHMHTTDGLGQIENLFSRSGSTSLGIVPQQRATNSQCRHYYKQNFGSRFKANKLM